MARWKSWSDIRKEEREAALAKLVNGERVPFSMQAQVAKELELSNLAEPEEWAALTPDERRAWLASNVDQLLALREQRKAALATQKATEAERKAAEKAALAAQKAAKAEQKAAQKADALAQKAAALEAAIAEQLGGHLAPDLIPGLVRPISDRLLKALMSSLAPDEKVHIMLTGLNNEALVCTDWRVLILKAGFYTGQFFGSNVYQLPYANVAGAEVRLHLLQGYFQLNAGGMNSTDMSVWNYRWGPTGTPARRVDPARAPNAIALSRWQVDRFRQAAAFITRRVSEAHRG